MLAEWKFNIVLVDRNKGTGMEVVEKFDQVVIFNGKKILGRFKS
jgi:hypothetical protein